MAYNALPGTKEGLEGAGGGHVLHNDQRLLGAALHLDFDEYLAGGVTRSIGLATKQRRPPGVQNLAAVLPTTDVAAETADFAGNITASAPASLVPNCSVRYRRSS
jgi:hypothetical protein